MPKKRSRKRRQLLCGRFRPVEPESCGLSHFPHSTCNARVAAVPESVLLRVWCPCSSMAEAPHQWSRGRLSAGHPPAGKQHPCPSNTRHWIRQFLVIYRCLAMDRWSSPSRITLARQQYDMYHARDTHCPHRSATHGPLLGHRTVESSAIGPHRQTYALTHQVSRGGAAAHIVPSVQQGAVRRRHTLFKAVRERHWRPLSLVTFWPLYPTPPPFGASFYCH